MSDTHREYNSHTRRSRSRSRSRSRNTRRNRYANALPFNTRSENLWTSRGSILNSLPDTNISSNYTTNSDNSWSVSTNSSSVNTAKRGMYTVDSNFKPEMKTPLRKASARRYILADARVLREKLLDALRPSTKPETIDTDSLYKEMNQLFYDMRPWREVFLRDEYKEINRTIGTLYDRVADKYNNFLESSKKTVSNTAT